MNRRGWIAFSALVALMVLAVATGVTAATLSDPETSTNNVVRVRADWWDLAWHYRKPITITNSIATTFTNYQVKVTVDTASLIHASPSKMKSAGEDIRFTNSTGTTVLDYWIDKRMDSSTTIIWVEVNSIPATTGATIYMYYGNSGAAAYSNGDSTFIYYNDFESAADVSEWSPQNGGGSRTYAIDGTQHTHGANSMYVNDANTSQVFGVFDDFPSDMTTTFAVDYDIRPAQNNDMYEMRVTDGTSIGPELRFKDDAAPDARTVQYCINTGAWTNLSPAYGYLADHWYSFSLEDIRPAAANDTYDINIGADLADPTLRANDVRTRNNRNRYSRIYFVDTVGAETPKVYVDTVRVRLFDAAIGTPAVGGEQ